jgi:hypothetical protein
MPGSKFSCFSGFKWLIFVKFEVMNIPAMARVSLIIEWLGIKRFNQVEFCDLLPTRNIKLLSAALHGTVVKG